MNAKDQPHATRTATSFVPPLRALIVAALFFPCVSAAARAPRIEYSVVATHAHDVSSFTQGLAIVDGTMIESSGGYGQSRISKRVLRGERVLRERALSPDVFGEGVASDGSRILQLTWQSGFALLWSAALEPLGQMAYSGEGWGVAWDGAQWLMSDGSDRIVRRRAADFQPRGSIAVRDGPRAIHRLNELEYVRGLLLANVWHTDSIAAIDPATGVVLGWLELGSLKRSFAAPDGRMPTEHVLNGIAYDPATGHLLVTGKKWPVLFELKIPRWPAPGSEPAGTRGGGAP